jgi:hypothetical protein
MKRLIIFLLSGCWHEWETIEVKPSRLTLIRGEHEQVKNSTVYTLRCKHCGEITKRKISYR